MRRLMPLILIFALLLSLAGPVRVSASGVEKAVIGYYASWASGQGYTPDKLPAERFTQINYAFAEIENGRLALEDPVRDKAALAGLTALRKRNPDLKIVLSAGGWDGSGGFSNAASNSKNREIFAQSCLELVVAHGLDGVDLDWEYPVSGGASGVIHRTQDKENFTLLLQAIRDKLDRQGRQDKKQYILTIAGAVNNGYLNCIEPQAVAGIVDHVFLMAYDIHGPWDAYTNFNAPLNAASDGPVPSRNSVDDGITTWIGRGVPAEKLVLGMPLYGYIYQSVSSLNGGLYSGFSSAKSVAWDKLESGYLNNSSYRQYHHTEADVPYLYGKNSFITYEDEASIAAKADLARQYRLGGIGFWELSQDTSGDLIESACTAWNGQRFNDVPQDAWYAGAVETICAAGLMQGTGSNSFSPGETVTRGQIAAILYRMAGSPPVYGSAFRDVSSSAYYGKAVIWASKRGVVEGFDDGTFRPNQPVTRQQFAAILWRYAKMNRADSGKRTSLEGYRDAETVSAYAVEPLGWALAESITQGTKDGDLLPHGKASRAQTAVMLERFMSLVK